MFVCYNGKLFRVINQVQNSVMKIEIWNLIITYFVKFNVKFSVNFEKWDESTRATLKISLSRT